MSRNQNTNLGHSLLVWLLVLSLVHPVWSQENSTTQKQQEQQQQQEQADPAIPETVVTGRPNLFPRNPLDPNAVLTINRSTSLSKYSGSSVSVVSGEELSREGRGSLADALRGRLGIDVVRSGGAGAATSLFLRGANSAHTKVLLDGMPLNDPSNASRSFDFANLTTENIERVEILRGPQSVLYGSDAIGGVVNIITKRGNGDPTLTYKAAGGSFGTSVQSLTQSAGDDRHYYSIAGSFVDTHNVSQANSRFGNTESDDFYSANLSARIGWITENEWNIDYVLRYNSSRAEIDDWNFGDPNPVDNLIRANVGRSFANRILFERSTMDGRLDHRFTMGLTDYDREDTDTPWDSFYRGQTRLAEYQADYTVNDFNLLTIGAGYQHEEASSESNPLAAQTIASVFAQDQISFSEQLHAGIGFRHDDHSAAGKADTYRMNLAYHLNESGDMIHAALGTGFRAPALAENLFAFGNPNLAPEESRGWEVGITRYLNEKMIVLDATYFRNDFRNLIVWDPSAGLWGMLNNVGHAQSSGVELTADWELSKQTKLRAMYTFTNAIDLDSGLELARRPRNKVNVTLRHNLEDSRTSVGLRYLLVGSRRDGGNSLAPYTLLDVFADRQLDDHWSAFLRFENVLDTQYEEVFGYGTRGFGVYAGLTYTR